MIASRLRTALATAAVVAGGLAPFAGSPSPRIDGGIDVAALASAVSHEDDHVTAIELARWIRSRKPQLRVIDLRDDDAFEERHIAGAEPMTLQAVAGARFSPEETIVLYSAGGTHAAQAWVFLRARGVEHVFFLRGGFDEWRSEILEPQIPADAAAARTPEWSERAALSRYFGGIPRRGGAATPESGDEKQPNHNRWSRGC